VDGASSGVKRVKGEVLRLKGGEVRMLGTFVTTGGSKSFSASNGERCVMGWKSNVDC